MFLLFSVSDWIILKKQENFIRMLQSKQLKQLFGFSSIFPPQIYAGVKNCRLVADFTRSKLCLVMKTDFIMVSVPITTVQIHLLHMCEWMNQLKFPL